MKIQNKLGTYLAVTAGVGCASSVANAAVVFYGNAGNTNIQADPNGLKFESFTNPPFLGGGTSLFISGNNLSFGYERGGNGFLTRGVDMSISQSGGHQFVYHFGGNFSQGGVAGDQNYANISFNANSNYEAVAQFYLDGSGGGYLMAIATLNDITNPQDLSAVGGPYLSISAGKAMIDAAAVSAVPEPSSHLALLALGAGGLTLRRRLKRTA